MNHDADHAVFHSLARDNAIDKTMEHAYRMGMYRDVAMRQACLSVLSVSFLSNTEDRSHFFTEKHNLNRSIIYEM